MHADIEKLATSEHLDLKALRKASELSIKDIGHVKKALQTKFKIDPSEPTQIDLVLLGSYGRQEATKGSDFDHLVLLHSSPSATLVKDFIAEVNTVRKELDIPKPGASGLFGEIAIGAELYIRIGLEADSNTNTTRRLLLLTESISAYSETSHRDLLQRIIQRYCADYEDKDAPHDPTRVPHFLLNDLSRYWRTICVDFGAKKWRALAKDWHVRYAKLLTSRKLMFAGSLVSIFLTPSAVAAGKNIVDHLLGEFQKPALARLAGIYPLLGSAGRTSLRDIFEAYNRFIEILDAHGGRDFLEKLDQTSADVLVQEMLSIGKKIEGALEVIFYDDPLFQKLTRQYGLF